MAVIFELTRDPELLSQYYELREKCFRVELGLPEFDGSEDLQDKRGQILIAHEDGVVLAGARITSSWALPAHVLDADLSAMSSCMWERLVINPVVRSLDFSRDFCGSLVEMSRALGYRHALILSSMRNARHYRRCHTALDVQFQIRKAVPDCAKGKFAGLEHYLSVAHLQDQKPMSLAA